MWLGAGNNLSPYHFAVLYSLDEASSFNLARSVSTLSSDLPKTDRRKMNVFVGKGRC